MSSVRIGHGFDVHAFDSARPLLLGGVMIPGSAGLAGHSDADVVLHAVTDALLGAAARGDIGEWFPDSDQAHKGADSADLLRTVWSSLRTDGWQLENLDVVVMAQKPKLSSHKQRMQERIAELLGASPEQIGIKATTTERLGFVGREEGIACSAVCLLRSPN